MKLSKQDWRVLRALDQVGRYTPAHPTWVGGAAQIRTYSVRETAARHLIKLTKLGLAEKRGTRMFPSWIITEAGRQALKEQGETP